MVSAPVQASYIRLNVSGNHWPVCRREQTEVNNEYTLTSATLGNVITVTQVHCCIFRSAAEWMLPVTEETGSTPKSIDF